MKTIRSFWLRIIVLAAFTIHHLSIAAPRLPQPPWPQPALRIYGFDAAYWQAPWSATALYEAEGTFAESWTGYSLVRDGFGLTPVVVPVEADGQRPTFALGTGAVRFWISTSWSTAGKESEGTGPGRWARLLEMVSVSGKLPEVKWSLGVNEAGDTICLAGSSGGVMQDLLKAPVQFAAGDWRMVTLCYSPTSTVLQVDNEIVAAGDGLAPLMWWETNALGLVIGSDVAASPESIAGAQFEEVTTLARWPQKSDWQELYFLSGKRRSLLGPQDTKEMEAAKVVALKAAGWLPEDYGEAKSSEEGDGPMAAYSYAPESLWLEITGVSNGLAYVIVHGTVAEVAYEMLSKESLTNAEWAGESPIVIGAVGQDWTPTTVTVGTRTNELFLWARTLVDTDGGGLPDWWELAHELDPNNPDTGGTGVSDGYKDGDNDGWTNLQEYQNGTSPSVFNTPAAPQGFSIFYHVASGLVEMNWQPVAGPVTGYSIYFYNPEIEDYDTVNLSAGTTSYTNYLNATNVNPEYWLPDYYIQAHYPGGDSAWSEAVLLLDAATIPHASVVRGTEGGSFLVVSALPKETAALRLTRVDPYVPVDYPELVTNFTIWTTNLVNGTYLLPESWTTPFAITSGSAGYAPTKTIGGICRRWVRMAA